MKKITRKTIGAAFWSFFLGFSLKNMGMCFNFAYVAGFLVALFATRTEEFLVANRYLIVLFVVLALVQKHTLEIWAKKLIVVGLLLLLKVFVTLNFLDIYAIDWSYYNSSSIAPDPTLISFYNYLIVYVGQVKCENLVLLLLPGLNFLFLDYAVANAMMSGIKKIGGSLELLESAAVVLKKVSRPVIIAEGLDYDLLRARFFLYFGSDVEQMRHNRVFNAYLKAFPNIANHFNHAVNLHEKAPFLLPQLVDSTPLTEEQLIALADAFTETSMEDVNKFAEECVKIVPFLVDVPYETRKNIPQMLMLSSLKYYGKGSVFYRPLLEHLLLYYGDSRLTSSVNKIGQIYKASADLSKALFVLSEAGVLEYEGYRKYIRSPYDCAYVDAMGKKTIVEVKMQGAVRNEDLLKKRAKKFLDTLEKVASDERVKTVNFIEALFEYDPAYEENLRSALKSVVVNKKEGLPQYSIKVLNILKK